MEVKKKNERKKKNKLFKINEEEEKFKSTFCKENFCITTQVCHCIHASFERKIHACSFVVYIYNIQHEEPSLKVAKTVSRE